MKINGFVKVPRPSGESPLDGLTPSCRLMYYELIRYAEYRPYETYVGTEKVSLKPNQCLVGVTKWAEQILDTSRTNVRYWLERLAKANLISIDWRNGYAVVTMLQVFVAPELPTDIAQSSNIQTVTAELSPSCQGDPVTSTGKDTQVIASENANCQEDDKEDSENIQPTSEAPTGTKNVSKNYTKNSVLDSELDKSSSSSVPDAAASQTSFSENDGGPSTLGDNVVPINRAKVRPETKAVLGVWWFCRRVAILSCGVDSQAIPHSPSEKHIGILKTEIKHWGQGDIGLGVATLVLGFTAECEQYNQAVSRGNSSGQEFHFPLITKITRDRMGILTNNKRERAASMAKDFSLDEFYKTTYEQSKELKAGVNQ